MKSFLLREKKPLIKWSMLPDGIFFEGAVPSGFNLAVTPSKGTIIIDVDQHGDISGFDNIPHLIQLELDQTFNYNTKNNGKHYWFKYLGNKELANKTSGLGFDLRTHKGYVVYYPDNDIREQMHLVKESSDNLNQWLEKHFSYV